MCASVAPRLKRLESNQRPRTKDQRPKTKDKAQRLKTRMHPKPHEDTSVLFYGLFIRSRAFLYFFDFCGGGPPNLLYTKHGRGASVSHTTKTLTLKQSNSRLHRRSEEQTLKGICEATLSKAWLKSIQIWSRRLHHTARSISSRGDNHEACAHSSVVVKGLLEGERLSNLKRRSHGPPWRCAGNARTLLRLKRQNKK